MGYDSCPPVVVKLKIGLVRTVAKANKARIELLGKKGSADREATTRVHDWSQLCNPNVANVSVNWFPAPAA
jgi:hypothetical protein